MKTGGCGHRADQHRNAVRGVGRDRIEPDHQQDRQGHGRTRRRRVLRKPQASPAPNPSSKDQISFDIPQMNLSCSSRVENFLVLIFDALFHPNTAVVLGQLRRNPQRSHAYTVKNRGGLQASMKVLLGSCALRRAWMVDFRNGSKADITSTNRDVRFTPKSGHSPTRSGCLLWANSGSRPSYSITSSAMDITPGGMVRPSALAVVRLMTRSNLFACSTGSSAGLAPLRMLPL